MSRTIISSSELGSLPAYQLVKEEQLKDLDSTGLLFRHKKSGARIIVVSNEDENKVFSVGFPTPPADSTGVAHIVEHTVLCGSRKFPAKDPFVELVKGSLNTFLNAMTYPDRTIYPIASCNEQDFQNLMDVYLDAVFHPNIYQEEKIFLQEGWHYELESEEADLKYNGIVYNEMKGAFSSPDEVLARQIQQSLFPDNAYGTESGGDPDYIPDLTYEAYLDFHRKFYHPSNSYIYLYGNLDIEEKLNWIDKEYLNAYDKIEVNSKIPLQKSFHNQREEEYTYSLSDEEPMENQAYLSYNTVVGTCLDRELYLAFQVLDYVLLDCAGAPLKQALLDSGIGQDILSSYDNGILQPVFSIIAKNTEVEKKEKFVQVIKQTLENLVQKGLEEKSLQAAINHFEFKYREGDFGSYPKGLIYGLQIMETWIHEEEKPFIHVCAGETFEFLKTQINTGYYENLIQKYILENLHSSIVVLKPERGLDKRKEEAQKEKLRRYKDQLSSQQKSNLVNATKELIRYQEEPASKEELEKIPMLKRSDIDKKARSLYNEVRKEKDFTILYHPVSTNGIAYINLLFDITNFPEEKVPYLGLLAVALGYVDSENMSFLEFSNEENIHTGGIFIPLNTYSLYNSPDKFTAKLEIKAKILYTKAEKLFELMDEMLFHTIFLDEKRLLEILLETKSRIQMKLNSQGHSAALSRVSSYYSKAAYFEQLTGGIEFYYFIDGIIKDFNSRKSDVLSSLNELLKSILNKERFFASLTCEQEGYDMIRGELVKFAEKLPGKSKSLTTAVNAPESSLQLKVLNEGFITSGGVNFVARGGNFLTKGYAYTGLLKILKVILNYDYLWINLRVKGGAYGCMSGFSYTGNSYLLSYRDPNVKETNAVYDKTPEFLKSLVIEERDMTKYIIGAISALDTPLTPSGKGNLSLTAYLAGITEENLQRERDEILAADEAGIRSLSSLVKAVLESEYICAIGTDMKITDAKELFYDIKNLL